MGSCCRFPRSLIQRTSSRVLDERARGSGLSLETLERIVCPVLSKAGTYRFKCRSVFNRCHPAPIAGLVRPDAMKVLQYLREINRSAGGVVTAMLDLSSALAGAGVEVSVLTCDPRDVPERWDGERGPSVTVNEGLKSAGLFSRSIRADLRDLVERVDLVHLHTPWDPLNLDLGRACRAAGVPYVVTMHGMIDNWSMNNGFLKKIKKRVYLRLAGRSFMESAAAVHGTADLEAEQAASFLPNAQFQVLPCIFDPGDLLDIQRAPKSNSSDTLQVLYLSRLHPKKRPDLLIEAAGLDTGLHIVLAGPGDDDYKQWLERKAEALGVADRVDFAGMVSGSDRTRVYADADCFCLPTSQENFGLVLPEAMAAEMPVVTTRGTAIWRELEQAGAWITTQKPADIVAALREVRDAPVEARARAAAGRCWVRETLMPHALVPRYRAMYEQIIASVGR